MALTAQVGPEEWTTSLKTMAPSRARGVDNLVKNHPDRVPLGPVRCVERGGLPCAHARPRTQAQPGTAVPEEWTTSLKTMALTAQVGPEEWTTS